MIARISVDVHVYVCTYLVLNIYKALLSFPTQTHLSPVFRRAQVSLFSWPN